MGKHTEVQVRNRAALQMLAMGVSAPKVAQELGASVHTIRKLMRSEAGQRHIYKLQDEMLGEAVGRLCQIAGLAVDALEDVLSDKSANKAVRAQTANSVLSYLSRLKEQRDLGLKVAELESLVAQYRQTEEPAYG